MLTCLRCAAVQIGDWGAVATNLREGTLGEDTDDAVSTIQGEG